MVAATPTQTATVTVEVVTSRHLYADGTDIARFEADGPCVPWSSGINLEGCDPSDERSWGTLRSAELGFEARHVVEALPADAPVIQTTGGTSGRQLSRLSVWLDQPGDLEVSLMATPVHGVEASPDVATASPAATVADSRGLRWRLPNVAAGTYEFRVEFVLDGATDARFLPEAEISLVTSADELLVGLDGRVGTGTPTQRLSRLVMQQRTTLGVEAPATTAHGTFGTATNHGLVQAFATSGGIDAATDYDASSLGRVQALWVVDPMSVSPGFAERANTMSSLGTGTLLGKAELIHQVDPWSWRRTVGLRSKTTMDDPLLGGKFYEADSLWVAWVLNGLVVGTREDRQPSGPPGTLRFAWDATWASAWATTVGNVAPHGEPNATNVSAPLSGRPAERRLVGGSRDGTHLMGIPLVAVAEGGDIDNRTGVAAVEGDPLRITPPDGHQVVAVFSSWVKYGAMQFEPVVELEGAKAVVVTPRLLAGGHWLETTRSGYDWDWASGVNIEIITRPEGPAADVLPEVMHVFEAPPGVSGTLVVLSPNQASYRRQFDRGRTYVTSGTAGGPLTTSSVP